MDDVDGFECSAAQPHSWLCSACNRQVTAIYHGCPAMEQALLAEINLLNIKVAFLEKERAAGQEGAESIYRDARKALGDDPDMTVSEMATNMRRHLDDAARFIAGLNLQDHPRATVQAQRAMVLKLNDVLRPQCSKNDVMASGAAYSNAALKDDTMADTIRVFAPGRRSPIDFKINLGGKDIGLGEAKRAHEDDLSRQLLGALPTSNLPVSTDPDVLPRRCGGCAKLINERGTHGCLGGVALGYAR